MAAFISFIYRASVHSFFLWFFALAALGFSNQDGYLCFRWINIFFLYGAYFYNRVCGGPGIVRGYNVTITSRCAIQMTLVLYSWGRDQLHFFSSVSGFSESLKESNYLMDGFAGFGLCSVCILCVHWNQSKISWNPLYFRIFFLLVFWIYCVMTLWWADS